MKTLLHHLLFVCTILAAANSSAQTPTFPDLADRKDVTTVFVSKAMLNSLGRNAGDIKQFSIKDMAKSIQTLEIITCEEKPAIKEAKKALKAYVKNNRNLEVLAKIKDDGEEMVVYGIPSGIAECYSEIVMSTLDENSDDMQIIVIKGSISMKDLSKFRMHPDNTRTPSNAKTVIQSGDTTTIIYGSKLYKIPHRIEIPGSSTTIKSNGNKKSRKRTMNANKVETVTANGKSISTVTTTDSNGHRIIRQTITDENGETIKIKREK